MSNDTKTCPRCGEVMPIEIEPDGCEDPVCPMLCDPDLSWLATAAHSGARMSNYIERKLRQRIAELEAERDSLFDAIAHGDQEHRNWLKQAITDHFAGRPVQRPQGKGMADSIRDKALEEAAVAADNLWDLGGEQVAEAIRTLKGGKG